MKPGSKERRGRPCEIEPELWPELQRLERSGMTQKQLMAWLFESNGIVVSKPTMSRVMARIRQAAPSLPDIPPPDLAPANDEDERKILRKLARDMMDGKVEDWKQAAAGATLLMRIRAEEQKPSMHPAPDASAANLGMPRIDPPQLTPEQEAELVRMQLGKTALA